MRPSIHHQTCIQNWVVSSSSNTGAQTSIFPGHISQLLLRAFPGQCRDIVCLSSPRSASWPSTSWMWLEYLPRGMPRWYPYKMSKQSQLAIFYAKEQQLCFEPLTDDWVFKPIPKGDTSQSHEIAHFGCLYLISLVMTLLSLCHKKKVWHTTENHNTALT